MIQRCAARPHCANVRAVHCVVTVLGVEPVLLVGPLDVDAVLLDDGLLSVVVDAVLLDDGLLSVVVDAVPLDVGPVLAVDPVSLDVDPVLSCAHFSEHMEYSIPSPDTEW